MTAAADERRADLHAHTTASDGVYPPEDLVRRCAEAGLWAVAVTDHDSLAGLPVAQETGQSVGVCVFPGVELSCLEVDGEGRRYDIHLLGLFLCEEAQRRLDRIEAHLEARRRERFERGQEIVRRLAAAGIEVPWSEVEAEAAGASVGRPHVARVLIRRGLAGTIDEAFSRYLSPGRPGHVEHGALDVAEAVAWIREAGGAAVWAHPKLSELAVEAAPWLELLDGLEAEHPKQDAASSQALRAFAAQRGLIATGGSDCHGTGGRERVGVCTTAAADVVALTQRGRARSTA
jgi:3',5'-nucleoside bisphosphate phosphatase